MTSNKTEQNEATTSPILKAAQGYVKERGWTVFPLQRGKKVPAVPTGFKAASARLEKLEEWWNNDNSYNLGIPTGGDANLLVLDTDESEKVSGAKSLVAWELEHSPLPKTLTATTANGGMHRYFRFPDGMSARNRTAVRPGIDVRAEGGYVVAPPSVVNGKSYSWVDESVPVAEIPAWLLAEVTATAPQRKPSTAVETVFEQGSRNDKLFRFVISQLRLGTSREKVSEVAENANNSMCMPPLDGKEVQQIVDNAVRLYGEQLSIRLTDMGNGKKLAELHGDKMRYVFDQKCWLIWNGVYWEVAPEEKIFALAKDVPNALAREAERLPTGSTKKELARFAQRSESLAKLKAMIELVKSEPGVGVSTSMLDQHKYVLPVQNGTINLRNGKFSLPDRDLLLTQIAGASYDPTAKAPRWEAFLLQIMAGDIALVNYIKRMIGYVLTASTAEQCLFFLYGVGANGKSTFLNIVLWLLGALGIQAASETLMDKRSGGGTSSDLARLRGKRFVAMSESDDGRHLNEAQVKSLTGGDVVVARELYQSVINFTPSHKLFLASNHMPVIKSTDHGIWRRIRLVPFKVIIKPEDRNPNLEKELREELSGILNWAIAGCLEWQEGGMPLPKAVQDATNEYRTEMDLLGSWITEKCIEGPFHEVTAAEAYQSFNPWCEENYNVTFSKSRFGRMLRDRGIEAGMKNGSRTYKGLTMRNSLTLKIQQSVDEE